METPHGEVEDISEQENCTSEESETSENKTDENIVTQTVHNVQHIQYDHQNTNWALDPPPRSGCLTFIKAALRARKEKEYDICFDLEAQTTIPKVLRGTTTNYTLHQAFETEKDFFRMACDLTPTILRMKMKTTN
ncbi:hypothetical protein AVEN_40753-1 [Araneus ventricosus]|uniref:Uncharacterized protein n=1 Tax=Araneus ventricosus TaxID=182803 RepID=A0A4Y2EIL2_ARAVE|nr:hypothetical protein AVEN_40753-1 [Araneus ventricosus]